MDKFVKKLPKKLDNRNADKNITGTQQPSDAVNSSAVESSEFSELSVNRADEDSEQAEVTCTMQVDQFSATATKSCNTVSEDPVCPIPKNRLERESRLSRGPYQPLLKLFPRTKTGNAQRSFQSAWYGSYKWLEYSPSKDAAFCFYCRFFARNDGTTKGHVDQAFIEMGFKQWHKANERFKNHQLSKAHLLSSYSWSNYKEGKPIDVLLEAGKEAQLSKREEERRHNRKIMERLIDIVLCLAKAGKPFRGHNEQSDSFEHGLFLDLVNMLKKYDSVLAKHLQESPRNATYLSNRIQNDLIVSLHNVVQQKFISKLNGKMVSIIADDTTDCGHHEQMSVVIRYFDDEKRMPVEHFVSLQRLLKVDAQSIFDRLNQVLSSLKIDWSFVLSVCFDGAATMSGCSAGVQVKCKEMNNEIQYVHCYAHCLNLVLVDACTSSKENRTVFDFFGIIQTLYAFMEGSAVRHAIMENISQKVESQLKTLKSLSNTRWACRAEAVAAVKHNYSLLILALEEIIETTRIPDCKVRARGLLQELNSFKFIFALNMLHPILQMIVKVSKSLQSPDIDLITAITGVKSLRNALSTMRAEPDKFKSIFCETVKLCEDRGIEVPQVKKRKVPSRVDDAVETQHQFETREDHERVTFFYPLIDSMICGIDQRFQQETCELVTAMVKLLSMDANRYEMEMISNKFKISLDEFEAEVRLLRGFEDPVPKGNSRSTITDWIEWLNVSDRSSIFSSFYKSIKCFAVMPVTSCSCERCFSKLTHIKSKLRSTMLQNRLDSLLLLYIEQELATAVNYDEVIDEFKSITPGERRMLL